MKKLTVVLGSPREDGVTAKVAEQFIEGAMAAGYEVVEYSVNHMAIAGCQGCAMCRTNNVDCVVGDDMQNYFKDVRESEALLITAPNYYSQIAGPMITFMNRHYCMCDKDRNPRLEGRSVTAIYAQGAPEDYDYTPVYDWYTGVFERFGFKNNGYIVIGGDSDISEDSAIMKEAFEKGKNA